MKKERVETCVIKNDLFTGQARAVPVKKLKKRKKKRMIAGALTLMICAVTAITVPRIASRIDRASQREELLAQREEELAMREAENVSLSKDLENAGTRIDKLEKELAAVIEANKPVPVTYAEVDEKLATLGTLPTYTYEYSGTCAATNTRQLMGYDIPGTSNNVQVSYNGVIQTAYRACEISYRIEEDSKTIVVNLPKPVLLDNYLVMDDYKCVSGTNLMNRVGDYDVADLAPYIEEKELDNAIRGGLYEQTENSIRRDISNYLAVFDDYKVEFETNV